MQKKRQPSQQTDSCVDFQFARVCDLNLKNFETFTDLRVEYTGSAIDSKSASKDLFRSLRCCRGCRKIPKHHDTKHSCTKASNNLKLQNFDTYRAVSVSTTRYQSEV